MPPASRLLFLVGSVRAFATTANHHHHRHAPGGHSSSSSSSSSSSFRVRGGGSGGGPLRESPIIDEAILDLDGSSYPSSSVLRDLANGARAGGGSGGVVVAVAVEDAAPGHPPAASAGGDEASATASATTTTTPHDVTTTKTTTTTTKTTTTTTAATTTSARASSATAAPTTVLLADDDAFVKSLPDKRHYRAVTLSNSLTVLLASDPSADVEAASVHVRAGHFDDPADRPGLAHFHEHMLFLGTEKYPAENEYEDY